MLTSVFRPNYFPSLFMYKPTIFLLICSPVNSEIHFVQSQHFLITPFCYLVTSPSSLHDVMIRPEMQRVNYSPNNLWCFTFIRAHSRSLGRVHRTALAGPQSLSKDISEASIIARLKAKTRSSNKKNISHVTMVFFLYSAFTVLLCSLFSLSCFYALWDSLSLLLKGAHLNQTCP